MMNKLIAICFTFLLVIVLGAFFVVKYTASKDSTIASDTYNSQVKGESTSLQLINITAAVSATTIPTEVISTPTTTTIPAAPSKKPVATQPRATDKPVVPPSPPRPQSCTSAFNGQFLTLINDYRVTKGKSALTMSPSLNSAACGHSTWMSNNSSLSHTEGEIDSPMYDMHARCKVAGMDCNGEIVATNSDPSAQNIFNQWKNSTTGHNEVMLGNYSKVGIGLGGMYATADFR